jgi:NADPH:quinone reductase-like Zn-dependent oxidoreductase
LEEPVKALRLNDPVLLPATIEQNAAQPQPSGDELLIRVHAAGVTPTELLWYPTTHIKSGEKRSRAIPGHEFSGVVAAVGSDVRGVTIGEEIYGMNDWFADGATAEYCVTKPQWVAAKPARMTHAEAASVPISALTAWQGLFVRAKLQRGERVLIQGGAGAVGVFAVALAKWHGARVIATASARHADFLLRLGAEQVIDYRSERVEERAGAVDVVFDAVGGETLRRSWAVLKSGGRLVTIATDSEGTVDERTKQAFFIVEPNRTQLIEIGILLDSGEIQAVVDCVVPIAQASEAYAGRLKQNGRGKVVIAIV